MVDLTADAQAKLTAFGTELPGLIGFQAMGANLPAMIQLQQKLTSGQGIDPAVRDQIITSVNNNPDVAIAAMRQQVQKNPNIISTANADPNKVLPQMLGVLNAAAPAVTAEVNPAGAITPPGEVQANPVTPAAQATISGTPEQKADLYLTSQLDPIIAQSRGKLPEGDRAAFDTRTQAWRTQVRDAIIGYEATEVTPEKAAEILRQNGARPEEIDLFNKQAAESKLKGLTPMQQAVEGFKAVDMARHPTPHHDKKAPDTKLFLGSEANVEAMFRSRIYQSEQGGLTADQLSGLGRNASLVDLLTGKGAPEGIRVPNYNLVRPDIDEKTRQPVAVDPNKAAAVTQPVTDTPVTATSALNTVLDTAGSIVGGLFGVTPAHAEEMPVQPAQPVNAVTSTVQTAADKPVTRTAIDDRVAAHDQLVGEIAAMGMQMSQRPGVKKLLEAAQHDQDMALAIKNITGIDVHADPADMMRELQGMSTEDLEAKKASMSRMDGIIGGLDPMLAKMSPQAVNSLSTLVNGGSQLMNLDGNSALGGISSMFSGGNFDISKLMSGFQGMGGIGDLFKSLMTAFTTFMGEMFNGFGSSGQLFGASNSNGELTGEMAEMAKLQPGVYGRTPTVAAYFDDKGKPANDPLNRPKLATDTATPDPAARRDVALAQPN